MRAFASTLGLFLLLSQASCTEPTLTPAPTLAPQVPLSIAAAPTALGPLQDWIEVYRLEHPEIEWDLRTLGPGPAQQLLAQGQVDLALLDQAPAIEYQGLLTATAVVSEAVVLVVHPDNPLRDLSRPTVRELFSGRIADWSQVGGHPQKLQIYLPPDTAGEVRAFQAQALAGGRLPPQALLRASAGSVVGAVAGDPAGLGLAPANAVSPSVATLTIDGISSIDPAYPWNLTLYLAHGPDVSGPALDFLEFVLVDQQGG
ncbi:MAG: substrate-binding domain-containing protein [Chloroflexia bacterium]|nr:substrate-binding domain-containing protein [Chloroflexia bacterium]